MELQQLKYFATTAKYQHITNASQILHIAQPALSQSIHRLEEELGVKLFEKNGRNIILTNAGIHLQQKLDIMFTQLDNLPYELKQISDKQNKTISINVSGASLMLTDAIIKYKKLHPDITFHLARLEDDLISDITISVSKWDVKTPANSLCYEEDILLAIHKDSPIASSEELQLSQLKDQYFLTISKNLPLHSMCLNFCKQAGFIPNSVFETDNPQALRQLVVAGLGVAFWPQLSWGKLNSNSIKLLKITEPVCKRKLIITRNSPKDYLEHTKFLEFLNNYICSM